ncbi:bifunctional diguanylate cyclase/phosphohydrolase [Clostridium sp. ZS2-4]|uniref:bifunctional diguanylate cyclase/phosphohydrolase n=1 Tax=Clostridium sp. ZS2-4 TaxID=2987703 RepID=UPI00227BAA92|nr:diguanylate cyclase [Clostridium sp. ZS2-4]MCY6354795.1 diguanylate cyclase [Clostridium sp. ZS2-4]
MNGIENIRQRKILEIISIVKLASLLFCGIIIFTYSFNNNYINFHIKNNYFSVVSAEISICILALIYTIWSISSRKKLKYTKFIVFIENFIFIIVFFILILLSGAHTSQYKFLFLFIIISSTIQMGIKHGIIISCISSVMLLGMDLVCMPSVQVNQYFENDLILSGIFILTALPLGHYVNIENEYRKKLAELVNIDGLTRVFNHRYFHQALKKEIVLSEKTKCPISLILLDIDYFKHYNDLYGHQKGDEVLRKIGFILKSTARSKCIPARYGGEEFTVILPDTSEKEAISIAEQIRLAVEQQKFEGEENQPNGKLTVSVGVSTFPNKAKNDIDLVKSADDALYRAKFFNKNRVETYYSVLEELEKDLEEEHIDLITSIKTLISVINAKDRYTYAHSERVVMFSKLLGEKLNLCEEDKKVLKYGAYMHDIGKINISKEVLNKKMPLTNEEWELLKQHPVNGIDMIKSVDSLKNIIPLILHHHERYDGEGYPDKLKGKDIPYLTRMLTVTDSFDAMTSNRPYNIGKSYDEAILELQKCSSTQFDPDIVEAFIEVVKENKDNFDNLAFIS